MKRKKRYSKLKFYIITVKKDMEKDIYILLIYKKLDNQISETELEQLNIWLAKSADNQALADDLALAYDSSADYLETEAAAIDVDAAFEEQLLLIADDVPENVVPIRTKPKGRNSFFKLVGAAAAVLFLGFIGSQYLEYRTQVEAIVSSGDESRIVTFVDGSVATLAPNSTIKYSNYFNEKGRFVELVAGAANFSVVKEKGTFRVKTARELVTVLGTIFDVKLEENQTKVSVQEGKVNVRQNVTEKGQIEVKSVDLTIGESVISATNSLMKTKMKNKAAINYFEFQETDLKTIVTNLEVYFNTKIVLDSRIENCRLTVTFEKQPLEEILIIIDKLLSTKHQKNSDGFKLSGVGCK